MPDAPDRSIDTDAFPALARGVYANHAAIAPWPAAVAQAVADFARDNHANGVDGYAPWLAREKRLRADCARLVGAESGDDIAFLKNTSEGISITATGLDWRAGDNVVGVAGEFPSNVLPWRALRRLGVEYRAVDVRAAEDAEAALLAAVDRRTRVVAVSAVQWTDGFRLDLARLGEALATREALFFVDAIQALGALPVHMARDGIDVLAADAHKWLLGPEGIAVYACREAARQRIAPSQHGWRMADDPYRFDRERWTPSATARRYEPGSPNMLGIAALDACVALLLDHGMDRVGRRVLDNTERLLEAARELAVRIESHSDPRRRSGIVSLRPRHLAPAEWVSRLRAEKVSVTRRGEAVRFSPHFYQHGAPVEALVDAMGATLAPVGHGKDHR